jgi:hypothetical protein
MVRIIDLGAEKYNSFVDANNLVMGEVPIGAKATLQESQKISDTSTSVVATAITNAASGLSGQITAADVTFYTYVLNAIDNMILASFARDFIMPQKLEPVEYYVTKSNDINMDIALFYYAVEYPSDKHVDTAKLATIKTNLTEKLGITFN